MLHVYNMNRPLCMLNEALFPTLAGGGTVC